MNLSDNLRCVFSARVEEHHDSYIIEVPKQEITHGNLQSGIVYRTALVTTSTDTPTEEPSTPTETGAADTSSASESESELTSPTPKQAHSGPPVREGDIREVEIEAIGDQGDGIARVERGYVIIVPETEKGDQVTIEVITVRENVAFAEVMK